MSQPQNSKQKVEIFCFVCGFGFWSCFLLVDFFLLGLVLWGLNDCFVMRKNL